MNRSSGKTLMRVLGGESLQPPPIWLMRQAGRYLPEYKRLREQAGSFLDLCFDPNLAAEVTLQPVRRFGLDAAILFADILLVPHALGQRLWFEEGEGPQLEPIAEHAGLAKLRLDMERVAPVFETVRRVKRELPADVGLIGFAGSPWTVATYMIAGRGTPDQAPARRIARENPSFMAALYESLVEATVQYLNAQVEAGAEVIQLFDTWAGSVEDDLLDRLVIEPTAQIVAELRRRYPEIPVIGFPRNIGLSERRYVEATGVNALSVSQRDFSRALKHLPPHLALQGGLDPLALVAGGEALERAVASLIRDVGRRPYIFNLGHGILPSTPPEHVSRLIELVRGSYG